MNPIIIPESFNYIGVFLTFHCQLRCDYCINNHNGKPLKRKQLNGEQWIRGLKRIQSINNIPLTFQGGEPTLHKDFFHIVNNLRNYDKDVLTNLEIDADYFMKKAYPTTFKRESPYASIRVSYHHGQNCFHTLIQKVLKMQKAGFSVGIWEVDHPEYHKYVLQRQEKARAMGIDYRTKEFLGMYKGKLYGTMKYQEAVNGSMERKATCTPSELLIDPAGDIYRCHSDLYAGRDSLHNIMDKYVEDLDKPWRCEHYGTCNACDIKIKNNRFQEFGHTSVEIKRISPAVPDSAGISP